MGIRRIDPWRKVLAALQAMLALAIPFVRINGQSALRFDIPSLRLYFFGSSIAMDEFFLVLTGVLFALFMFIALTMLFGRLWCGWSCPQTVLADMTSFMDKGRKAWKYIAVLGLSVLVSADILWYFVSPYEFMDMLAVSPVLRWSFIALSIIIFIDLTIIRRTFCKTICPYARLQSVLFDDRTMLIAYDPAREEECMDCAACCKACPMEIDIRDGLDIACISCAKCMDACADKREKVGGTSLIGYFFGSPAGTQKGKEAWLLTRPLRVNALIAFMVALAFIITFAQSVSTRQDFEAAVRLDSDFITQQTKDTVINAYIVSITNHTMKQVIYSVKAGGAMLTIREVPVLPPGGAGRFRVYALANTDKVLPEILIIEVRATGSAAGDFAERLPIKFPAPIKGEATVQ